MNRVRNLFISYLLSLIAILLLATPVSAQTLTTSIYSGKVISSDGSVSSWDKNTSLSPGDKVKFGIQVRNDAAGTAATSVNIKVSLPGGSISSGTANLTVTASNASSVSDSTNLTIASGPQSLSFDSGSTVLTWDSNGDGTKETSTISSSDIVGGGLVLSTALQGGDTYLAEVKFTATVLGSSSTSPPSSTSSSSSSSSSGSSSSPSCSAARPPTPTLNSATRKSSTQVDLSWTSVGNATSYLIVYGTKSKNYEYAADVGKTTSYTVGGLPPGVNFYFAVKAINDCVPSDSSNERLAAGGGILGQSTSIVVDTNSQSGGVLGEKEEVTPSPASTNQEETTQAEPVVRPLEQRQTSKPWVPIFVASIFVSLGFGLYLWFSRR